eukprot:3282050-Amphidinium_carterae.1
MEAIYEIHLSQNDIDDESAHELLRTLHKQRPRSFVHGAVLTVPNAWKYAPLTRSKMPQNQFTRTKSNGNH